MKSLEQQFTQYISAQKLLNPNDKLLVAVSGGMDSVVLCELCYRSNIPFAIAHCNFQLRGEESTRDENFVQTLAQKYNVPLSVERFETSDFAAINKISIQVAARELRYKWFEELLAHPDTFKSFSHTKKGAYYLATAHHLDDNVETLLMNFFKGTGISGLHGILPKKGHIIRPLLFARKEDIRLYAIENNLHWVEDSSNNSDKYSRNYFRHQVVPLVEKIYPEAFNNLAGNLERFRDVETLYTENIKRYKRKLLVQEGREWRLPVTPLLNLPAGKTILFELIKPFGFTPTQINDIYALLQAGSGKYVASATHRIIRNRNHLVISSLYIPEGTMNVIEKTNGNIEFEQGTLTFDTFSANKRAIPAEENIACLGADKIEYPLILRRWKQGDYFYPLGMQKKKKLSRFFIDKKLSVTDKERVWVLEMNKKIIWVIGQRIDDRFKVLPSSQQVLQITFNPVV